jgi:ribosomal protein S18 acetylase RimI-like enzyme
VTARRRA